MKSYTPTKMSAGDAEKQPILGDSVGIYVKPSGSGQQQQQQQQHHSGQQHLIIQPIEFDTKHRNFYGYLSLAVFILVLTNYLMIKERSCQFSFANGFTGYDLIQSFHLTTLIVAIIVFVLSYFNFAVVIHEFKLLFYSSAIMMTLCAGLLVYDAVAIVRAPCVPLATTFSNGLIQAFGAGGNNGSNIFSANDGIGITVFVFDLVAAVMMFLAGGLFYKR